MKLDAVGLEVMALAFASIAEEMGLVLVRSALSPNIRERRDCSAALFDADGEMIAQAAHIPVHLGAMTDSVAAIRALRGIAHPQTQPGDQPRAARRTTRRDRRHASPPFAGLHDD